MSGLRADPHPSAWIALLRRPLEGALLGMPLLHWQAECRAVLGLPGNVPIIATGHQPVLWHPGILVKYMLADAVSAAHGVAAVSLVVDQHVAASGAGGSMQREGTQRGGNLSEGNEREGDQSQGADGSSGGSGGGGKGALGVGKFEVPARRDAAQPLKVRAIELCRPLEGVPMGRHPAFNPLPPPPPDDPTLLGVPPHVRKGVQAIFNAVARHNQADNAAMQMFLALRDAMLPWVRPGPIITATDLMRTGIAHALLCEMARDPHRCAACYNRAVSSVPHVGVPPLTIHEDGVEMPLWRVNADRLRRRAWHSDVQAWVAHAGGASDHPPIDLMPRALFMTALTRLGMCDMFIHGVGGAAYDVAMERWMLEWLGAACAPMAMATADVRLGGMPREDAPIDVKRAVAHARRLWHDPVAALGHSLPGSVESAQFPSGAKREMLDQIDRQHRNSTARKAAYLAMHQEMDQQRRRAPLVHAAAERAKHARRAEADRAIAARRDWPFPVYDSAALDGLARAARGAVTG